jgi:hypothetical protein
LTNEPNLPVLPLANSESDAREENACLGTPVALEPDAATANEDRGARDRTESDDMANAHVSSAEKSGAQQSLDSQQDGAEEFQDSEESEKSPIQNSELGEVTRSKSPAAPVSHSEIDTPHTPLSSVAQDQSSSSPLHDTSVLERALANCQRELALLHKRLVATILDNAVAQARMLPVERPHWENALNENFENASAALANAAPKLNLTSRTESLPRVAAPLTAGDKQKRILTIVQERMRSTGLTFHQAWIETRSEHPTLF